MKRKTFIQNTTLIVLTYQRASLMWFFQHHTTFSNMWLIWKRFIVLPLSVSLVVFSLQMILSVFSNTSKYPIHMSAFEFPFQHSCRISLGSFFACIYPIIVYRCTYMNSTCVVGKSFSELYTAQVDISLLVGI